MHGVVTVLPCAYCRAQKLVDTTMAELGVAAGPAVATRATCGAYLALRAEVISMLEMRKTLQHRYSSFVMHAWHVRYIPGSSVWSNASS